MPGEKPAKSALFANRPFGKADGNRMATAWQQHAEAPRLVTHETDVDEQKEEIFFGIDAAITSTRSGIADTGTLIIWPTADEPRSLSLVPPVHFALLEVGNLHNTFAEVLKKGLEQSDANQCPAYLRSIKICRYRTDTGLWRSWTGRAGNTAGQVKTE